MLDGCIVGGLELEYCLRYGLHFLAGAGTIVKVVIADIVIPVARIDQGTVRKLCLVGVQGGAYFAGNMMIEMG